MRRRRPKVRLLDAPRCCASPSGGAGRKAASSGGFELRAGVRKSEYGRDYRIGYGMQVLEQGKLNLQLGIDAERRESPIFQMQEQGAGADQRVLGK